MRPSRLCTRLSLAAAALLAVTPAASLVAQRAPSGATFDQRRNIISINPLGIPFEYFTAEYEGVVSGPFSLGGVFSYFSPSHTDFTSFELDGRLYPNEHAPEGFSVGMGVGAIRVNGKSDCFGCITDDVTKPTVHVFADYNWLLGPTHRFVVGTGVGAKRIFGIRTSVFDDVLKVYPTVRFQIGAHF